MHFDRFWWLEISLCIQNGLPDLFSCHSVFSSLCFVSQYFAYLYQKQLWLSTCRGIFKSAWQLLKLPLKPRLDSHWETKAGVSTYEKTSIP